MKRRSKIDLWATHSSTILSITLVLWLLGILCVVEYHSYFRTHDIKEQITFKVDLAPDISDSLAYAYEEEISQYPYIKHVDYISKEEAAELFAEELGDDFVGFIGYNPLYPSLMVNFRAERMPDNSTQVLDNFTSTVSKKEYVTGVAYQENVFNEINDISYRISWFLIVLVMLLLAICIILINSTIRIALYAQRDTIQTMRLVGAKMSFITRPYLRRSILYGAVGGLIASTLTLATTWIFNNQFFLAQLFAPEYYVAYAAIAVGITAVGMLIAFFSALIAVRHNIK